MCAFIAPDPQRPVTPGNTPTWSVLIGVYQAAATVAEAIESALSQQPPPLEVIVCDDGSTDDLDAALAPFAGTIEVLRRPHRGEAAAKNAAAATASGDYIVFLDADDVYLPGRLEALGRLIARRPDLDIVTTDAEVIVGDRVVRRCYHDEHRFARYRQDLAILRSNFVFGHAAVRRVRFEEVGGFDEEISHTADWDCWLRMILDGSVVGLVDRPLSQYRLHARAMSTARADMARGRLQTLTKAARRTDLDDEQRATVVASIRRERTVLTRAELHEALVAGSGVRTKALGLMVGKGVRPASRLKALLVAIAPRAARRRYATSPAGRVRTVGDIPLESVAE